MATKTKKKTASKSRTKAKTKRKGLGAAPKATAPAKKQAVKQTAGKKLATNTIVMTTLAVGAAGVLGYFGWQFYKKKKSQKAGNLDQELLKVKPVQTIPGIPLPSDSAHTYIPPIINTTGTKTKGGGGSSYTPPINPVGNDDFPLKKGSKGESVRAMQQSLIGRYGKSILPKYGADGDFGSETVNALKKAGLPTTVDESTYNVIVQGGGGSSHAGGSADIPSIAKKLYDAAVAKNFSGAISLLKQLKSQDDYQQASEKFKTYRLHGVRQTLVNGMLSSFTTNDQKQKIRFEFIRMGLKYDGSKWSLSGFDGKPIVTKEPAIIWVSPTESIQVPAMMVLGSEVTRRLDYTMFENKSKFFLVKTESVKYL